MNQVVIHVGLVVAGVDFHQVSHVVWCVVGFGHCLVCFGLLYFVCFILVCFNLFDFLI